MPPAPVIEKQEQAAVAPEAAPPPEEDDLKWSDIVKISGYAEAYYSWNFNKPDNEITANRWLDEKNKTFTLQTVALDVAASHGPLSGQVTLMFGPTADRWYFEDAAIKAGESDVALGFGAYSNETWKHIQNAWAGYKIPIGDGLNVQGGLMATQVGYEVAAVKDNWNFSRSNLFNFLPFFHVGLRASYPVTETLTLSAAMYNGWNQTSDVSKGKSFSLGMTYAIDKFALSLLYLGGNERRDGDPAGKPWRNLFDLVTQVQAHERLTFGANLDGGFEANDLGTDAWFAAALYARVKAAEWLYFAVRGDGIYEKVPSEMGVISPILLGGADHIISGTFTAEVRPFDGISFRVEYRHDASDDDVPLFYKKGLDLAADGMTTTQRLASSQDTLTLGMAGWF